MNQPTYVILETGTIGAVNGEAEIGETVTVLAHDENGATRKETGVVAEVL